MKCIIGWDISTSAIGICVVDPDGERKYRVIFPHGETQLQKHRSATQQITDLLLELDLHRDGWEVHHFVEDFLGGFTGGLTTRQTLMKLAAMNAIVSHCLSSWGAVTHISPSTVKKIVGLTVPKGGDKKIEVIKLARQKDPSFPYAETVHGNYVKGTDDMADAMMLAIAGKKILSGEAQIGQSKKASSGSKKTRRAKAAVSKKG